MRRAPFSRPIRPSRGGSSRVRSSRTGFPCSVRSPGSILRTLVSFGIVRNLKGGLMKRVAGFLLVVVLGTGCAAVPPQHVGVLESFGKVYDTTWGPGLHPWAPWFGVHRINCRTLQSEEQTTTPTGEGLLVGLDVSLVYHANPDKAAETFS